MCVLARGLFDNRICIPPLNLRSVAASHTGGVMPGHSRPKDGVASLAYDPGIHAMLQRRAILRVSPLHVLMDPRVKPGGDSRVC